MTTRKEKIRKLRALARSPNKHEATLALAKAQGLEAETAKAIARAIAQLLQARGLVVRVKRREGLRDRGDWAKKVDADVRYFCSRDRHKQPFRFEITVVEWELG
jgi:hypothetical protein